MQVNMNPETKIRYGVISANTLDPDVVSDILTQGTSCQTLLLKEIVDSVKEILDSSLGNDNITESAAEALWDIFSNQIDSDSGDTYHFTIDGVKGCFNTDSNIVTIFESSYGANVRLCSPCYPNAGDLDSPDEDGYLTYAPPADWFTEEHTINPFFIECSNSNTLEV